MTSKYDRLNRISRCAASVVKYRQWKINFLPSSGSLSRLFRVAILVDDGQVDFRSVRLNDRFLSVKMYL